MEHSISVSLPDDVYRAVVNAAALEQCAPEQWIASQLKTQLVTVPTPPEDAAAFERDFEKYLGCFDSGDPDSADNKRIDQEIAREYGNETT